MRIGVTLFATDQTIGPIDLARAAEVRGFASLFLPEHTHIPVSRETPAPTGETELAEEYKRTLDPFVALAAAAAVTTRIRLGTGICLIAQRDPIVTAKEVATLDLLSGGRFVFGIGYGWNREELAQHGVEFRARRAVVRERVLAMERLWADDEARYDGTHVHLAPSWAWPKPVQRPRPPILIGGAAGPTLFAHVAELADGWMPIGGAGIAKALPELHRRMEDAGRDPGAVQIVPIGVVPDEGKLAYYARIGVSEVVLRLPSAPGRALEAALDAMAPLVERYAS